MESYLFLSLKENAVHGTPLVPFSYYHCQMPETLPDCLLHWHEEAEINLVRKGCASYQIDQSTCRGEVGDIFFIAPNTLHAVHPISDCAMESDTLIFHFQMLGYGSPDQCTLSFLRPLFCGTVTPPAKISPSHPSYPLFLACLEKLFACVKQRQPYFELELKEHLFHFLLLLYRTGDIIPAKHTPAVVTNTDKIKQSLQYIQDHYTEAITIDQLAQLCHFSKPYFMNFFKCAVGMSCMNYIIQLRLRTALEYLKITDLGIADIALECGFNNLSNFNRLFKERFACSPREYRRQNKEV